MSSKRPYRDLHDAIVVNLIALLSTRLANGPCWPATS